MDLNITTQGWIQKAELDLHKAFEKELDAKLRKRLFDLYNGEFKLTLKDYFKLTLKDYIDWEEPLTKIEVYKLIKIETDLNNDLNKLINE